MLKVGEPAPAFRERDTRGEILSLGTFTGRPLVVYFFHKAFTPNCTVELKGFRDNYGELSELGFEVIGVSTDSHATQCDFAAQNNVTHRMIADEKGAMARSYGVLWPLIPFARRVAYVLDPSHVVRAVFRHEFQVSRHLDEIVTFVRGWKREVH